MAVLKYDLNGNPDASFGTDGLFFLDIGSANGVATKLLQQPDGMILVAGWTRFGNKEQYVVARLSEDGVLDTDFGVDGIATGSVSGSSFAEDEIADAAFLSDGRIVAAGRSYNGQSDDGFMICLNPDGSLDDTFGNGGAVVIDFEGGAPSEIATAIAVNANDEIFVGGRVSIEFGEEDSQFITKFDDSGIMDPDFGTDGSAIYTIAPNVIAGLNALAIDNEGRILAGGGAFDTDELDNNFFLTRFDTDGLLDVSFGIDGSVILPRSSNESIEDLVVMGE